MKRESVQGHFLCNFIILLLSVLTNACGAGRTWTEFVCVQEFRQELGKLKYHSRSVGAASTSHARSDATSAALRASSTQL